MKTIITIIVILILAVGGYFLYTTLFVPAPPTSGLPGITNTNFLTSVFSNEKFKTLKEFVPSPVEVGQEGKINPFMKF